MTRLPQRFTQDRALRDSARAVLTDDIARLRASLSEQGIAARVSSSVTSTVSARIRAGARDVLSQVQASDYKGVLALLVGAIILFLAREPILAWLECLDEDDTASVTAPPEADSEGDNP